MDKALTYIFANYKYINMICQMFICQTSLKFVPKIDPQIKFEVYILKENIIYYPYVD